MSPAPSLQLKVTMLENELVKTQRYVEKLERSHNLTGSKSRLRSALGLIAVLSFPFFPL